MKAVGREGAFYKDITALHTRYVTGKGATHIALAYAYLKCAASALFGPCMHKKASVWNRLRSGLGCNHSAQGTTCQGSEGSSSVFCSFVMTLSSSVLVASQPPP